MSRRPRFDILLRVAEAHAQDAARLLAEQQVALQGSQDKLRQLILYRSDYAADFSNNRPAAPAVQLRDQWLFLDRLNRAIAEQHAHLDQVGAVVQRSEQQWRDAHNQRTILGKVAERIQQADRDESERRNQKLLDELAGTAHIRSKTRN